MFKKNKKKIIDISKINFSFGKLLRTKYTCPECRGTGGSSLNKDLVCSRCSGTGSISRR